MNSHLVLQCGSPKRKHQSSEVRLTVAAEALSLHQITKDYPGVRALDGVNLPIFAGEIHGIVGANGAGKSTLVKILSGLVTDYEGSLRIENRSIRISSPRIALKYGISVLQQEPELAWNLTVCENILLGAREIMSTRIGLLDRQHMRTECTRLLKEFRTNLPMDMRAGQLSRGQLQVVQIIKTLAMKPKVLVLDEPTVGLTDQERESLFDQLRARAAEGTSVIFISHNIEEVFQICRRITVLRDGRKALDADTAETAPNSVLREMFGAVPFIAPDRGSEPGPPAIDLNSVNTQHFSNVSVTVHKGEVVGLAGRTVPVAEVLRAVFGAAPRLSGLVRVHGHEFSPKSPRDAIRAGIGLLPEDRGRDGLFLSLSVLTNISIIVIPQFTRYGWLRWRCIRDIACQKLSELSITAPGLLSSVRLLSGGNQQKTLFARWLCANPQILLLEEPTAGMDVAAKNEIVRITLNLRRQGVADIDELLRLCDRVIVLRENGSAQCIKVDSEARPLLIAAMTGLCEAQ